MRQIIILVLGLTFIISTKSCIRSTKMELEKIDPEATEDVYAFLEDKISIADSKSFLELKKSINVYLDFTVRDSICEEVQTFTTQENENIEEIIKSAFINKRVEFDFIDNYSYSMYSMHIKTRKIRNQIKNK